MKLGAQVITDPQAIFHNSNDRPITLELHAREHLGIGRDSVPLTKLVATCDRNSPNNWKIDAYAGQILLKYIEDIPAKWINGQSNILVHPSSSFPPVDCTEIINAISTFSDSLYVGPFRSAISQSSGTYYDLEIGSQFITTWNNWKSGGIKWQNHAIDSITQNIREIFRFDRLEINPAAGESSLHVWVNGQPFRLSELGAGLCQFLVVFANAAIKKPSMILIDEPELNLHPTLQTTFLTALASYAPKGIVFATHSVGLSRSVSDKIYSFQKTGEFSIVKPFESIVSYAEFLGEMSFAAFQDAGFDSILLVEGVNDVRTLHQFLRLYKKQHRIVVLPLGGNELASGRRELELGEIRRLSKNIFALVDSERASSNASAVSGRKKFSDVCKKLEIPICITERRAIENYLSGRAIKVAFGPKYDALKEFERLDEAAPSWSKSESWRAAREMMLEEIEATDVGKFLTSL